LRQVYQTVSGCGSEPVVLKCSFVGGRSLAEASGQTDAHVIVTQIVPYPLDDTFPIVCQYRADLRLLDPSPTADFGDVEGYIAGRILTLALGKIQGSPTREAVIDALESLGQFDLGLGEPLHLSRKNIRRATESGQLC
jgi:branched-chain amino acid transport system substrate-binding protein